MQENWFNTAVLAVILAGLGYSIFQVQQVPTQHIAMVNVAAITAAQLSELDADGLSSPETARDLQQADIKLKRILENYAADNNIIILPVNNQIYGAIDITPAIVSIMERTNDG